MKSQWIWKPNLSVGLIRLGDNISYYDSFNLIKGERDSTDWISYKLPDLETYIDAENDIIVSISSFEEFYYKGINLIGIKVEDLENIFSCKPDEIDEPVLYEDGDIQTSYTYNSLGLTIWINDNNKVVSASCIKNE